MFTSTMIVEVMVAHYWAMVAAGTYFMAADHAIVNDTFTKVVPMTAHEVAWFARL